MDVEKSNSLITQLTGVSWDNPSATPEDVAAFKKMFPGESIPLHPSKALLQVRADRLNNVRFNSAVLAGTAPSTGFDAFLLGVTRLGFGLVTSPLGVALAVFLFYIFCRRYFKNRRKTPSTSTESYDE